MSEESSNRGGRSQVSTVDLMVIIIIVLFARILIERAMPLFYESFGLYFGEQRQSWETSSSSCCWCASSRTEAAGP